jgi:hypothetical protein
VHLNDSHANTTDTIMSCFWLFTLTVHWIKPETSEVGKYNYKILGWNEKRNVMIKPEDPARRQIQFYPPMYPDCRSPTRIVSLRRFTEIAEGLVERD